MNNQFFVRTRNGSQLFNGSRVTISYLPGCEATCVCCGRTNAMICTTLLSSCDVLECRDCHIIVIKDGSHMDRREGVKYSGVVIMRNLGKSCNKCGSFDMVEDCNKHGTFTCQKCNTPQKFW